MDNLHKMAMIVGLIAMMGLGLLLCFVPSRYSINHPQYTVGQEQCTK